MGTDQRIYFSLYLWTAYVFVCMCEPPGSLHLKVLRLGYEAVVKVPRNGKKGGGVSQLCFAKGHLLCKHLQK